MPTLDRWADVHIAYFRFQVVSREGFVAQKPRSKKTTTTMCNTQPPACETHANTTVTHKRTNQPQDLELNGGGPYN